MTEYPHKKPHRKRSKETRPAEILNSALHVFAKHGYTGAKLDDIAAHAGVSKGTIYLYFENKEKLFQAVIRTVVAKVIEREKNLVIGREGEGHNLLPALIQCWWGILGDTGAGLSLKLLIAEAGNFPELSSYFVENVIRGITSNFVDAIKKGISTGEFRDLDAGYVARIVLAQLMFAAVWGETFSTRDMSPHDIKKYLEAQADLLLNGLVADV